MANPDQISFSLIKRELRDILRFHQARMLQLSDVLS